ncbi:FkbM family methyltransferase [Termitidicoccus mucosus]|uniref:Methyltransferase FkbM domain-containing protein n=1 Tax=Termitidicoccus mucosus TaxID=1184151 RepID=A0A178ICW6_9BACT|nr:hypothetical protein AW736_20210 [Opitutaceae bacterium TSB47]
MLKFLIAQACTSLANLLLERLRNKVPVGMNREEFRLCVLSFSQFGEDLAALRLAQNMGIDHGIYVDVGAFHPIHLSNTLLLYKKRWRGVNIDTNPQKIDLFNKLRPGDCNVCAAISDIPAFYKTQNAGRTTETISILEHPSATGARTQTLDQVLARSPFANQPIDYLNIDCEKHDIHVLKSVSLETYRPAFLSIEALDFAAEQEIRQYLEPKGYSLCEKIHWTLFFKSLQRSSR